MAKENGFKSFEELLLMNLKYKSELSLQNSVDMEQSKALGTQVKKLRSQFFLKSAAPKEDFLSFTQGSSWKENENKSDQDKLKQLIPNYLDLHLDPDDLLP